VAVHSMKDVPTEFPRGLHLSVITEREDPRDVLISRDGTPFKDLPKGAKIGTSSLRRQAQLLHFRPDFEMIPLRGNVQTRLRKLGELELNGIVLALAGVRRMGLEEKVTEILPTEITLPAIGQGALGVETRMDDEATEGYLRFLNDPDSTITVLAERAFLKRLEGGCQVPIAAYGRRKGSRLQLEGVVGTVDGKKLIRHRLEGPIEEAEPLGLELAEVLLKRGGREILDEIYGRPAPVVSLNDGEDE
jgi:hydroxymethylbilane synthase